MNTGQDIFESPDLGRMLELFTVVIVFNRDLEIEYASDLLSGYMPALANKPTLSEVFVLARPASVTNFDEMALHRRSLFLLTAVDESFAVRGQVVSVSNDSGDFMVFCGAPWMAWMTANQPEVKLGLKDFSPQDAQIDQLFYMETESRVVADLEQLNAELQQAQTKLKASEAARSAFFAQMSHEMRTPLNGIVSALSLMRQQKTKRELMRLLDLASKSSQNLMQVVNYVLDVSKLESADVEPTNEIFSLSRLIESVVDIVQTRAMEKNLALHTYIDEGLADNYLGDSPRLRQILLNLVINAIKFTDRGAVTVTLSLAESADQAVRFEVADTGAGIPTDMQACIFQPFRRLEDSNVKTGEEGTGLGLDIVRRNVDAMEGRIGIASSLGVGSTFWIELPLQAANPEHQLAAEKLDAASETVRFSGCVLLVDDNETNLMLGSMILEGMGVRVLQANGGEIAVAMALNEQIDLVLMDISMPGIDGYEATRLIRREKDADALPVVALTAYASSVEREKSRESGMNDYLTKPISREQLAGALTRWLKTSAAPVVEAGPRDALVERAVIEAMLEQIGPDSLALVIGKFGDEAVKRWQALENATSSSDLAREAHTLASTCQSFGLPTVAERLRAIEASAKAGGSVAELEGLTDLADLMEQGILDLKYVVLQLQG